MKRSKSQHGQGLTEYIVMLCLIVVAAIGVLAGLKGTIKNKVASIAMAISGEDAASVQRTETEAKKAAKTAENRAKTGSGGTSLEENKELFNEQY